MRVLREKIVIFLLILLRFFFGVWGGGGFSVIAKDKHCGRVCAPTSIEWALLSLISNCWIAHIAPLKGGYKYFGP